MHYNIAVGSAANAQPFDVLTMPSRLMSLATHSGTQAPSVIIRTSPNNYIILRDGDCFWCGPDWIKDTYRDIRRMQSGDSFTFTHK